MAISDAQKVDLLYKKYAGAAKTDTAGNKSPGNEATPSPEIVYSDKVWTETSSIPSTAAAVASIVQAYQTTSKVTCTSDTTTVKVSGVYPTWKTGLTNWIPPSFDTVNSPSTYAVKVYFAASGTSDPTTGTAASADGVGGVGEWNFDYASGVLNFIGGTIPTTLTSNPTWVVYVTGYRYIGKNLVQALSDAGGAGAAAVSVTSAELASTSATLESHISVVSAAVTTVSQAVSVETAARISADNALSIRIDSISQNVSVTSADLASAKSNLYSAINVVSNALSIEISDRISADNALSIRIDSISQNVSVTSADLASAKSNLYSAINVISNALSDEISNRISAVNRVSHNLSNEISDRQSAVRVVSNALSQEISVRIDAIQDLSGKVASIANAISGLIGGAISVTSAALISVSATLENHINLVSASLASVDTKLSTAISAVAAVESNVVNIVFENLDTTVNTVIDTTSMFTSRTVGYIASGVDNINNHYKASRMTVIHDGSNVYFTEYDVVYSNMNYEVMTFDADISNGNLRLLATGDSANVTVQLQKVFLGSGTQSGNLRGVGLANAISGNLSVGGNMVVGGGIRKPARIITTTATLAVTDSSGFIQLTGASPYTLSLPDPSAAANSGIGYRFWQNTAQDITLSTSVGAFYGPNGSTASTKILAQATTQYWDVWSDGYNWIVFAIKTV